MGSLINKKWDENGDIPKLLFCPGPKMHHFPEISLDRFVTGFRFF